MVIQDFVPYEDNIRSLIEENNNYTIHTDYEYLDDKRGIFKIGLLYSFYIVSNINYKLMI